jgi:NADH:ubiquinone oxidoreductase subunit D
MYTKDNGERSNRLVAVVAEPKDNYLCYDVSSFSQKELEMFKHYLNSIDTYREETLKEFEDVTGIKISSLWRSFKPGGVEWDEKDDFI